MAVDLIADQLSPSAHIATGAPSAANSVVISAGLICLGLLVGFTSRRERRQRRHFEETSAKLSAVYEKVQANFEGMKRIEKPFGSRPGADLLGAAAQHLQ